ncbi:MAG: L,D-transpeptidase [Anaerolineales bacterium]
MGLDWDACGGSPLKMADFTRRDFLKLAGVGLLALLLPEGAALAAETAFRLGRVAEASLPVRSEPSRRARQIGALRLDTLISLQQPVESDEEAPANPYNRLWYAVQGGYVYSGGIQPVEDRPNTLPAGGVPPGGQLAEVTVPFAEARRQPREEAPSRYRLYYASTHWVLDVHRDSARRAWYRLYEDKWGGEYYVLAEALRLIPPAELAPLAADVPAECKRIEVDLGHQLVTAYQDERPVLMARASSGWRYRNGSYRTPVGRFTTYYKRPSRHMADTGYDLPGVPWVCYINDNGVSFHGTYWHNDYGTPRSHGCINLPPQAARWLYLWTEPVVPPERQRLRVESGTMVEIYL